MEFMGRAGQKKRCIVVVVVVLLKYWKGCRRSDEKPGWMQHLLAAAGQLGAEAQPKEDGWSAVRRGSEVREWSHPARNGFNL